MNSKKFRTRDGMSHPLTMNTELLIKSVELGEVKDANNSSDKGVPSSKGSLFQGIE